MDKSTDASSTAIPVAISVPADSIAQLVNAAFENPANTVSEAEPSGFSQALNLPEPDRQKTLDKMVRANMGFKVTLQK